MVIHPVKKALAAALLFILPVRFAVAADGDVDTNPTSATGAEGEFWYLILVGF
jgi:hypothetical protein